ncbi:muscarinic acetylcholine receptor M2-like [Stegostoma tigrinum]|uniref:muscarinic acetylcholine receptor M2-like n=1 Tax=Stegostoma tigrinum TaxID=3053191 RepID=UPI002870AFDE|nr:muscarinic acetylcholine receptor M2-like [Stegostoma tigrinum]
MDQWIVNNFIVNFERYTILCLLLSVFLASSVPAVHHNELMVKLIAMNETFSQRTDTLTSERGSFYRSVKMVTIAIVTGSLSLVTIIGNILVLLSVQVNRHLRTINNYFICSLACADLILGAFSMNLYTIYTVTGYWPLSPLVCEFWLAVDHIATTASGMNLLLISFDRYFCVTRPFSYPMKRTKKMSGIMITAAWGLSVVVWCPVILAWQFTVGGWAVNEGECYAQFFSDPVVSFGISIAAFFLPVAIMVGLYVRISQASRNPMKDDETEYKTSKGTTPPSSARDKVVDPKCNKILNNSRGLIHIGKQSGKIPFEITVAKEFSDDLTSLNLSPTNQIKEGKIQGGTVLPGIRCTTDNDNLSDFKVISLSQKCDNCDHTLVCKQGGVDQNGDENLIRGVRGIIEMTKAIAKKKRGTVTRKKAVTRTVLAILLAFIITWIPYSFMVLTNTFCPICIPNTAWTIAYWICYINSTINPACYALCNQTFKKTFKNLLVCQCKNIRASR